MAKDRRAVAEQLARWHFLAEPDLTKIFVTPSREGEPLRFIEVLAGEQVSGRAIEVFGFDPTEEVPYESEVTMISERELKLVKAEVLPLPDGWTLDGATTLERPAPAR